MIINEDQRTVEAIENALIGTTMAVVHVARSGQDGIDFLESADADVIVFRIPLPDWSPVDFVRELTRRWPDSRVIASGGDHLAATDLLRAGVRDWVAEGEWGIEELRDAILRAGNR